MITSTKIVSNSFRQVQKNKVAIASSATVQQDSFFFRFSDLRSGVLPDRDEFLCTLSKGEWELIFNTTRVFTGTTNIINGVNTFIDMPIGTRYVLHNNSFINGAYYSNNFVLNVNMETQFIIGVYSSAQVAGDESYRSTAIIANRLK